MTCQDCAVMRHELLQARAAITALRRPPDRLQASIEADSPTIPVPVGNLDAASATPTGTGA